MREHWHFSFLALPRTMCHGRQIRHCDGHWTGYTVGAHTGAGGQCANAIQIGVGADGPARILHTGTESGCLGRAKSGTELPTYCPTGRAEWLVPHEVMLSLRLCIYLNAVKRQIINFAENFASGEGPRVVFCRGPKFEVTPLGGTKVVTTVWICTNLAFTERVLVWAVYSKYSYLDEGFTARMTYSTPKRYSSRRHQPPPMFRAIG